MSEPASKLVNAIMNAVVAAAKARNREPTPDEWRATLLRLLQSSTEADNHHRTWPEEKKTWPEWSISTEDAAVQMRQSLDEALKNPEAHHEIIRYFLRQVNSDFLANGNTNELSRFNAYASMPLVYAATHHPSNVLTLLIDAAPTFNVLGPDYESLILHLLYYQHTGETDDQRTEKIFVLLRAGIGKTQRHKYEPSVLWFVSTREQHTRLVDPVLRHGYRFFGTDYQRKDSHLAAATLITSMVPRISLIDGERETVVDELLLNQFLLPDLAGIVADYLSTPPTLMKDVVYKPLDQ